MGVDASQHLALINRVISQMGLRGDVAEEAFSEGLVIITEASQKFDPNKQVPVANWLALNIRWSLRNWLRKQHLAISIESSTGGFIDDKASADNGFELKETLARIETLLSQEERFIVLASAIGYSGEEIAHVLKIAPSWVSRLKKRAQRKIKEAMQ